MRFYTLAERKPLKGQTVLAKIDNRSYGVDYYVLDYTTEWSWDGDEGKPFYFIEASGEEYMKIDEEENNENEY